MIEKDNIVICDVALIGYAINSTSGGYTNANVKYIETVGIKYLYNHFYETYCAEPVAFLQLAAELRQTENTVFILDGLIFGYSKDEMKAHLDCIRSSFFCFSIYESSKDDVIELMTYVKSRNPKSIIITGGPYATLCYNQLLKKYDVIDYIILGDSDKALPQLVNSIKEKRDTKNIHNVVRRKFDGEVIICSEPRAVDLNHLLLLERDFEHIIKEKGFSFSVVSSRGCGHAACSFCYLPKYQKIGCQPKFRYRDPELIIYEIKRLIDKYNIKKLTFVDDDFFGPPNEIGIQRAITLFHRIIEEKINIRLYLNARVASIQEIIGRGELDLMSKAGVAYCFIGFESYNNEILKKYNKGITTDDIDEVCHQLNKRNILINPGLITFEPDIRIDQVKRNIDLFRKINYYDAFMFTRTLMSLTFDNDCKTSSGNSTTKFKFQDTATLFYVMTSFRDLAYPIFVEIDRHKITKQIRDALIREHFKFFYSAYDSIAEGKYDGLKLYEKIYINKIRAHVENCLTS